MDPYDSSILKAADYIEMHIMEEITLDALAEAAAFSKFHFTRIFKAVTKENVNEYIRKRRMTQAAKELIETNIPILDLSLTYGYTSQEAFTRAFKTYIGHTPQSYRNKRVHHANLYKEPLSVEMLQIKKQPVRYEAMIKEIPGFKIGGLAVKGELQNHTISKLWNLFYEELHKQSINLATVKCFGYESIDENNTPYYLAAIEVDSTDHLPEGWSGEWIPEHKYAVFPLDNVIENIPHVIEDIYKNRLPALNVTPDKNFSFEFYDEEFIAHESGYTLQFYVPIR